MSNEESIKQEIKEDSFELEMDHARRIIKDIYGCNTNKSKIMIDKLNECKTEYEIDRVLSWGRVNLL